MTSKQHDQAEGFAELLEIAGSSLVWNDHPFTALIRTLQPKAEGFDLTPGDDNAVGVRAFVSAFPDGLPVVGDGFEDELGARYRVTRIIRTPGDLTVNFECEISYV
ncbi:hypothetical protein H5P28_05865 [Ruficoccus amylovorans]|uniref:Uncharacterized protein n=1 Tax=Ruficoccus amylovorans TaxID=1804625 RepID=A0A842HBE5_9BACT|nr:hypothetical protein [Ruficoccus amylovorans]MBC2593783.1 hypothetical protein [Ruficoccus amylovorans]